MNEMSAAIERLRFAVRTLPGVFAGFSEAESEQRPSPERWTRKEVVGHLIDSASNNHQRFVRGQLAAGQDFPRYEQEQWVKGRFRMEFRDRHVWLEEGEFLVVPCGVEHRPVADEEAHVLLFEPASTLNTGNVKNERTVAQLDRI
jgi:quercetin dioxygenase-like cupin family protein